MGYISVIDLLDNARQSVREISVQQLRHALSDETPLLLVDIRELDEWQQGTVSGAVFIPRGNLEFNIEDEAFDRDTPIALMCAGGVRSIFAAKSLQDMGYTNVVSVAGGFDAWKNAGYPFETPQTLSAERRAHHAGSGRGGADKVAQCQSAAHRCGRIG